MDNDSFGEGTGPARPPRDAITPGQSAPAPRRTVQLVSGDFLLTVNPVDGSEIEPCPPGEQPGRPSRRSAVDRAERHRAAQPPVPPGPAAPRPALLERDEERERLVRLLGRGRSVRLTGPSGSGRTALLDAVAAQCDGFAPDGVVRLNGRHRSPAELLQELFTVVYDAPGHRPDRNALGGFVRDIGAVVVLDDLEFGGAGLDELLDAAPECAFLVAATPDVPAPSADSHLEEVFLSGLGRAAALELLEQAVERPLTEEESNWAGDLWFESEGLPLRFVQAAALLRQCDELRADPEAFEEFAPFAAAGGKDVPLPTLGEGAAPAPLLASRLSDSARRTLRIAVALGGEVPHQAHLPALVGDTHADAALGELMSCGLLSPAGPRYRLAAGVLAQLREKGYDEDAVGHAHTAARHYTWWAGHPSVTPERAVAEADGILAALSALVPGREAGHPSTAVLLARSAAPAFAAGLHWTGWERALRVGSEAARIAGEVAEEAYFHHELGVLALCTGNLDRARAELETSIGMRGALADKSGTVAGRRALALVADRESLPTPASPLALGDGGPVSPPLGVPGLPPTKRLPRTGPAADTVATVVGGASVAPPETPAGPPAGRRTLALLGGARRNRVAAGAGTLLAAVLGTVVTLGMTSDQEEPPGDGVRNGQNVNEGDADDDWTVEDPVADPSDAPSNDKDDPKKPTETATPATAPTSTGRAPAPGDSPSPSSSRSGSPSDPDSPSKSPSKSPSTKPTLPTSPSQSPDPTPPPDSPSPSPTDSSTGDPQGSASATESGDATVTSSASGSNSPSII
ncbi:ATP-binding protein [Streptomyces peucetius]|uniref:ATP-binding protein n=1 Tax=Streptomyces peucetius TaxID=1950 RepID=A0ABY6IEZ6_STRPE|nr:ATP-binding protein [Streptomyces peucetius]UYQ64427.1 ATP-binding protein [Streptomyces peucetius]